MTVGQFPYLLKYFKSLSFTALTKLQFSSEKFNTFIQIQTLHIRKRHLYGSRHQVYSIQFTQKSIQTKSIATLNHVYVANTQKEKHRRQPPYFTGIKTCSRHSETL